MNTHYELYVGESQRTSEPIAAVELEQAIGRPHMWNVITCGVIPEYTRLGIAAALMKAVCRDADKQGVELWLTAEPILPAISREALVNFYEHLGFQRTTPDGIGYLIRRPVDQPPKN